MKNWFTAAVTVCFLASGSVQAQQAVGYMEEVKALGSVAGQGMACGASKYETFEMLARAILITKAVSNKNQADGMYAYNEAKANAYFSKQMDGFYMCDDINRRFDNQAIFEATLYADGTIKMPDGRIFTPRQPYDATLLYNKNSNERSKAQAIYDKGNLVQVGDLTIKTGSGESVKVPAPAPTRKINTPKTGSGTAAVARPAARPAAKPAAPTAVDLSGVRHLKRQ